MPDPSPRLMGVAEAARALGVNIEMIRDLVDRGALRAYRLPSGHRRVPVEAIAEFKERWLAAPIAPAFTPDKVEGTDLDRTVPSVADENNDNDIDCN